MPENRSKVSQRVLVIAPHPFYMERGTPIACRLLCETLCDAGNEVDLLTYPLGENIDYPRLQIFRTLRLPFLKEIPIGLSIKKLICDGFLFFSMIKRFHLKDYDVIHAGEESVFLAIFLRFLHGAPVVYDMDSSLADQVVEKFPSLGMLSWFLNEFEQMAFRESQFVLPVCDALAQKVRIVAPNKPLTILEDVFFETEPTELEHEDLRFDLPDNAKLLLYIGNLEKYQGIDLLLDGVAELIHQHERNDWVLKLVGGIEDDIQTYKLRVKELGLDAHVKFLGSRPLVQLPMLLKQANILLSPRTKGGNTPMKLYSYLASGIPVLATRIRSHTQAIDNSCSVLVEPDSSSLAKGLLRLLKSAQDRTRIGEAGRALAYSRFSIKTYEEKLLGAYELLCRMKSKCYILSS